jgi:hypothetical protein
LAGIRVDLEADGISVERHGSRKIGDIEMPTHRRDDPWCSHRLLR